MKDAAYLLWCLVIILSILVAYIWAMTDADRDIHQPPRPAVAHYYSGLRGVRP